jgi:RNA polymerase primary sigma factor
MVSQAIRQAGPESGGGKSDEDCTGKSRARKSGYKEDCVFMIHKSMFIKSNVVKETPTEHRITDGALCRAYQRGDANAGNEILKRHMGFCISMASRYLGCALPQEDLLQEAQIGLLRAAKDFDPDTGFQLTTYAVWWMRATITHHIHEASKTIRVPGNHALTIARYLKRGQPIKDQTTREANVERMAIEAHNATKCLSMDMETGEGRNIADTILGGDVRDEINPDAQLLRRHIADLPPRERQVIRLWFGIDAEHCATLREIGDVMGVSHERVRQLKDVGLQRLRRAMDKNDWV